MKWTLFIIMMILLVIGSSSHDADVDQIEMTTAKTFLRTKDPLIHPIQRDRRWWGYHGGFGWNGWGRSHEWNSWEFD